MQLIHLKNYPILHQLQLEEALLRLDTRNFCIINEGSPPAIIMGISGKAEELIDQNKFSKAPIPIIRRFSGGGTVVVDEDTLFISFLCQKEAHSFAPYPEPIMRWTEKIYKEACALTEFHLRENDYAIGNRKCGGNAQYLRKDRWLHHTTFLWDYQQHLMDLLLHPKKTPKYRDTRSHDSFVTKLKDHLPSKEAFITAFKQALSSHFFLKEMPLASVLPLLEESHRQSTEIHSFV